MGQAQCCQSEDDNANMNLAAASKGSAKPTQEEAEAVHFAETAGPAELAGSKSFDAAAPKEQRSESFTVALERSSRGLGIRVDPSDGMCLHIVTVEAGDTSVNEHNKRVQRAPAYGQEVAPNQCIVEINGKRGGAKQLETLLTSSEKLSMVIMKPMQLECLVNRNGRSLGLELGYSYDHGTTLRIVAVLDGAAKAVTGPVRPQANDRVVSVNGKSGDGSTLLEEIKKSPQAVTLGMLRLYD